MATEDLEWTGRAWPAAKVTGKVKVRTGDRGSAAYACEIVTTGAGREYALQGAWGFWRNFARIAADDETAVVDFIRRRGDPFGELGPDKPTDSGDWPSVSTYLDAIALLWGDADAEGISRVVTGDEQRVETVGKLFVSLQQQKAIGFNNKINWTGHIRATVVANSLAGFMGASAFFHLLGKTEMGVCQECGDWFGIQRQGTKFCSPSCRAAFSTKSKGASHG